MMSCWIEVAASGLLTITDGVAIDQLYLLLAMAVILMIMVLVLLIMMRRGGAIWLGRTELPIDRPIVFVSRLLAILLIVMLTVA